MVLDQVLGHPVQVKVLKEGQRKGALAHAYLFHGPSGVGKEFLAKNLAKALNCPNKPGDCCDACSVCRRIDAGTFSDSYFLSPSGASKTIKMDSILDLQKKLALSRFEGEAKTILIRDADGMNEAASNALLKILEEPMAKTYFFLISSNPEALLSTIRSRCRQMAFYPLPISVVETLLAPYLGEDSQKRATLAKLSEGSIEHALRLHEEAGSSIRQQLLRFVLSEANTASDALLIAQQMAKWVEEDKSRTWEILEILQTVYRDLAADQCQVDQNLLFNSDWKEGIRKRSASLSMDRIGKQIEQIERIRADIHRNIQVKFAFDYLFLFLAGKQNS